MSASEQDVYDQALAYENEAPNEAPNASDDYSYDEDQYAQPFESLSPLSSIIEEDEEPRTPSPTVTDEPTCPWAPGPKKQRVALYPSPMLHRTISICFDDEE